jgi:hypothetical protein
VDLTPPEAALLEAYVAPFLELAGTVRGIIAGQRLVCAKIAAFSPCAGRRAA